MTIYDDPFDAADNAQLQPMMNFGQCTVDTYFCILQKGVGKVPFDPAQHGADQRRTAITIEITPLTGMNLSFTTKREMIAESREWAGIVLPSLKALGLHPRELNGAWVKYLLEPTGRKYVNLSGEEKVATTFKFLEVYPDEAACERAWHSMSGNGHVDDAVHVTNAPAAPPNGDGERLAAQAFLKPLWEQSGHDWEKFAAVFNSNPILMKHFAIYSPEVVAVTGIHDDGVPF